MKKIVLLLIAAVAITLSSVAQVKITKVDKVAPTDEMFMDMAVTAANKSVKENGSPCGAVVILNGAWRSTGIPAAGKTAEEVAFEKSRRQTLKNATVYTVNEPTTEAYIAMCKAGAEAIYFVNPRQAVIAAGIYPASAYDDESVPADIAKVPMQQMDYPDAQALLNKK